MLEIGVPGTGKKRKRQFNLESVELPFALRDTGITFL